MLSLRMVSLEEGGGKELQKKLQNFKSIRDSKFLRLDFKKKLAFMCRRTLPRGRCESSGEEEEGEELKGEIENMPKNFCTFAYLTRRKKKKKKIKHIHAN